MQRHRWGRFCAFSLFSVGVGLWLANDMRRKLLAGKAAYLQREGQIFDKSLAPTHPVTHAIGFIVIAALCVALYELIAFGLSKLFLQIKS